jgi:hypothetical protein
MKITALHLLAVSASCLIAAHATTVPSLESHLVADYEFSGNANDASVSANDGVVHDATLTTDRFGNSNSAYQFNGSSSYIELPDTAVFNSSSYTVSMWFNAAVLPNHFDHDHEAAMLISKGRNDFELHLGTPPFTDSGIRFLPRLADPSTGEGWDAQSAGIKTGKWRNIIAVYDGSGNQAHLYLDGLELTTSFFSGHDGAQPSVPGRIGMRYDGTVPFNGSIDDVQIYNEAVTSAEVADLFSAQSQPVPDSSNSILLFGLGLFSLFAVRRTSEMRN